MIIEIKKGKIIKEYLFITRKKKRERENKGIQFFLCNLRTPIIKSNKGKKKKFFFTENSFVCSHIKICINYIRLKFEIIMNREWKKYKSSRYYFLFFFLREERILHKRNIICD